MDLNKDSFWNKRIAGIKYWEIIFVLCFYLFFAISYHTTLYFNRRGYEGSEGQLFDLLTFMSNGGLDYFVKLILTVPIWWLVFRTFRHLSLRKRLALHLIGLPLFPLLFQQIYYATTEYLGWGHLQGSGQVWDIYIPGLFYLLQFGIFHAYEYYHDNQKSIKLKSTLREAATKSELAALKAQINPHFLYNVFNTISASVPVEQEKTRELIAKLSDLFRYQLKASRADKVTLGEELNFVEKYLSLEQARFEDRLKIIIDVPDHLRDEMVPPMILQPLVENSVKHGISSLIDGGEISIEVKKVNSKLSFKISDTGKGVKDKSRMYDNGIGLNNTKLRLEKQYGSEMKISDNMPRGLKIEFQI